MSHNSLSIRVDLQIDGVDHIDETLKANRERIYYLKDKRVPSLTSYFCKDIGGGIIGIAFLRAACRTDGYGVNINEMFTTVNSELRTARTYAHELGHNVGMLHDFASVHGGRGGKCDKQGLMSYGQDRPDQWSTCSNSDYTNWWKKQGFACMKESTAWIRGPQGSGDCDRTCSDISARCSEGMGQRAAADNKILELTSWYHHGCKGYNAWDYGQGFSECTDPACCLDGSCQNHCSITSSWPGCGDIGNFNGHHSRICPCEVLAPPPPGWEG